MESVKESNAKKKVEIKDIIKIYKRGPIEVPALRGLTCDFYEGKIAVIMGPSGCGKTTLLNILGGVIKASSGKIFLNSEKNLCEFSEKELETWRRDVVAYVYQENNLLPSLNAYENIVLPVQIQNKNLHELKSKIEEIIALIGLENRLKHFPFELSGGEQQRVSIAAALVKEAEIILCDEPTGELDSKAKITFMQLLKQIQLKLPTTSIIIVTHDPDFKLIADTVFFIKDGRISYKLEGPELEAFKTEHQYRISPESAVKDVSTAISETSLTQISQKDERVTELEELKYIIDEKLKKIKEPPK